MAEKEKLFDDLNQETGIVFGFAGVDYLGEAIARARGLGETPRRVVVVSAAHLSTVKPYADLIIGAKKVSSAEEVAALVVKLRDLKGETAPQALVFNGLSVYAQIVLEGICGLDNPEQQHWQKMGRQVANDLRLLAEVCPAFYVTCEVVMDTDAKPPVPRLNINPGSVKLLLEDLTTKLYVTRRKGNSGYETVVQTDPDLALKFRTPSAVVEAAEGAETTGSKPVRKGLAARQK